MFGVFICEVKGGVFDLEFKGIGFNIESVYFELEKRLNNLYGFVIKC